jgi:hypothetical protein
MLRVKSLRLAHCENSHSLWNGMGGDWFRRTRHPETQREGIEMANARIDRMLRELQSEPALQFFQGVFTLDGPAPSPVSSEPSIPVSLLKQPQAA